MMRKFRDLVDDLELKELYMHGQSFTWSNERDTPMLTKIDRVLVSVDWELHYPDNLLQALSTNISDHALLHLSTCAHFCLKRKFRIEMFWTKLEGFLDAVKEAWVCDASITDPFRRLDALLRNTATYLQAGAQRKVGNIKLMIVVANYVILKLVRAQELRQLSSEELWLRRMLKMNVLGLASLEHTIARQRSRLRWLKEGGANTKLF
ncbi:uncharacterized protein [Aegilops tauschii subsp. strangulata]|uniref:uncharacterized protein n=1 Tax=Aegilops tauschii subsp. strangulata TaxID=200361 RepID=UPI003CC85A9D